MVGPLRAWSIGVVDARNVRPKFTLVEDAVIHGFEELVMEAVKAGTAGTKHMAANLDPFVASFSLV